MTTYYLLTRRQCTAIPATRAVLLSRTSGERWAVVRVGEGSVGVAPEQLQGELREWWDQASVTVSDARRAVTESEGRGDVTVRVAE